MLLNEHVSYIQLTPILISITKKVFSSVKDVATSLQQCEQLLSEQLSEALTKVVVANTHYALSHDNFKLKVSFGNIPSYGRMLPDGTILLSNKWCVNFAKKLINNSSLNIEKAVALFASTITHELSHAKQISQQIKAGRKIDQDQIESRSYFSDPKKSVTGMDEYKQMQLFGSTDNPRYEQLYRGSPQEIIAHAHNFAAMILQDLDLLKPTNMLNAIKSKQLSNLVKSGELEKRISHEVISFLFGEKPKQLTKIQTKVFNRYMKLTYDQIKNYIDHIEHAGRFKSVR